MEEPMNRSADIPVCRIADILVGRTKGIFTRDKTAGASQVGKPATRQTGMSALRANIMNELNAQEPDGKSSTENPDSIYDLQMPIDERHAPNRKSPENPLLPPARGDAPAIAGSRPGDDRQSRPPATAPGQLKIVVRVGSALSAQSEALSVRSAEREVRNQEPSMQNSSEGSPAQSLEPKPLAEKEPQQIPARMLNEFVYCPRLFYYEFVEGVFVGNADTLRGNVVHQRVDSGSGALPPASGSRRKKAQTAKPQTQEATTENEPSTSPQPSPQSGEGEAAETPCLRVSVVEESPTNIAGEHDTIHARSVDLGSELLGVFAMMDLVDVQAMRTVDSSADSALRVPHSALEADLFSTLVCPVDYKAGAPREGEEANELWDTDKMQLGLQALILRDNGYACNEGVIYYRANKQRVRLPITAELENWILQNIAEARRVVTGSIPAPLVHSPKCARCSLAPVCLPDETRMLAQGTAAIEDESRADGPADR